MARRHRGRERRLPRHGPARPRRELRDVRLHRRPRALLVGAARRPGGHPRRLREAPLPERHRLHQLQHLPGMAPQRHVPRHDALPDPEDLRPGRAAAGGPRVHALPRRLREARGDASGRSSSGTRPSTSRRRRTGTSSTTTSRRRTTPSTSPRWSSAPRSTASSTSPRSAGGRPTRSSRRRPGRSSTASPRTGSSGSSTSTSSGAAASAGASSATPGSRSPRGPSRTGSPSAGSGPA